MTICHSPLVWLVGFTRVVGDEIAVERVEIQEDKARKFESIKVDGMFRDEYIGPDQSVVPDKQSIPIFISPLS